MKNVMNDISVKRGLWQVSFLISILILMSLGMVIPTSVTDATNVTVMVEWEVFFGGPDDDSVSACIQTADGGFAALVTTEDTHTTLVKFTANGQQEWNTTFPGAFVPNNLVQTSDNGFVFQSLIGVFGQDTDVYLQKFNSIGQSVWNSTFGGAQSDWINSMILAEEDGFILAGGTNYNDTSDTWWDYDMWLVKTDSQGIPEWNHTFGGEMSEVAVEIIETSDGGYALAGRTNSYGLDKDHAWLVKTDMNGQPEWNKTFDCDIMANDLIQISDGSYILGGYETRCLIKADSNGNQVWYYNYDTLNADSISFRDVIQTKDIGYLLAGDTGATYGSDHDLWFIKTDSNGIHQWNTTFGGLGDQRLDSIIPMSDGGFVIAATTRPISAEDRDKDMWLLKVQVSEATTTRAPGFEWIALFFTLSFLWIFSHKRRP